MCDVVDDSSIDEILASEKLTVDAARTIILAQQKQIIELQETVEKLARANDTNPTERLGESYSLSAEAKRKQRQKEKAAKKKKKAKRRNKRNVRMTTAETVKLAVFERSADGSILWRSQRWRDVAGNPGQKHVRGNAGQR